MSTITFGSFGQAARTLDVVAEQKMSTEEVEVLNNGYLTDLAKAICMGTVPARDAFQKFLGLLPELKVWKTVNLGLHKTPEEYKKALEDKDFHIGDWARQIFKKITVSQTVVEVDLCVLTVAELGFKSGTRYDAICARIIEIGGQLCPDEVGPAMREQYPDQPYGEWNAVAMEPLVGSGGGGLDVFNVAHGNDGRWLGTRNGDPSGLFHPGNRIVFRVPRK